MADGMIKDRDHAFVMKIRFTATNPRPDTVSWLQNKS
jgi:hypothetical protein